MLRWDGRILPSCPGEGAARGEVTAPLRLSLASPLTTSPACSSKMFLEGQFGRNIGTILLVDL